MIFLSLSNDRHISPLLPSFLSISTMHNDIPFQKCSLCSTTFRHNTVRFLQVFHGEDSVGSRSCVCKLKIENFYPFVLEIPAYIRFLTCSIMIMCGCTRSSRLFLG